jgi:hypothetical protein
MHSADPRDCFMGRSRSSSGLGDLGGEVEFSSLSLALVNDAGRPGIKPGLANMSEWRLKVLSSDPPLPILSECLEGEGWSLTQDDADGGWYLVGPGDLGDGGTVTDEAGLVLDRINTVYRFRNPGSEPFSLALPVLFKDDGTREYFVRVSHPVTLEFGHSVKLPGFTDEIVDVIWVPPSSALGSTFDHKRAYERLAADPGAAAVIKSFIASPRDWCEIYKVVELIEKRCRGIPENWVSKSKLNALTGTACSWDEAGRTGRHANPHFRGPRTPMSLYEGEQITRHIVGEWLQSPDV